MRRVLYLALVAASTASPVAAQITFPSSPYHTERWSFAVAFGPVTSAAGGGADLMTNRSDEVTAALRRRLGRSRWWLGIDMDVWFATATPAGIDSLAARSGIPNVYTGHGADFAAAGLAASVRYDAWTLGPLLGYGLASVGANNSGGYLRGRCTVYPNPCEIPPVNVSTPGWRPAAMAGFGVLVHLLEGKGLWATIPSRVFAEARVANQGTRDGRLTTTPFQFGISW